MRRLFRHTRLRHLAGAIAAAAFAVSAGTTPVPASAAPAGNIVTLGDSYTANPDQIQNTLKLRGGLSTELMDHDYPSKGGCLQAPDNWPRQLAQKTGRDVADWSCNAMSSGSLLGRIDQAIAAGDLHEGTATVAVAVGAIDFNGLSADGGVNALQPEKVRANYLANIDAANAKIKSVAPNAQVLMVGMLAATDPAFPNNFCWLNVISNAPIGFPVPIIQDLENRNRANQQEAANRIGGTFVDIKSGSQAHNSCAPDAQRWVAGGVDTTTPNYHMTVHPSRAGSSFIADQVSAHL